ncbi:hypothetical protein ACVWW4_001327 [Bradyrhizobium sp. LB7.1]
MYLPCPHRDADKGARQVGRAFGDHAALADHLVEPLTGEDHEVGGLAVAQPLQQGQGRREVGIDMDAGRGFEGGGQAAHRAHQAERREHANVFHERFL